MRDCIWKMSNLCEDPDPDCLCKDYRSEGSKTGQYMKNKHPDCFNKVPIYIEATDYSNGTDFTVKTRAILHDGKIGVIESVVIKEDPDHE